MPYYKSIINAKEDMHGYIQALQSYYDKFYSGQEVYTNRYKPFDRTGFFVDKRLTSTTVDLGGGASLGV